MRPLLLILSLTALAASACAVPRSATDPIEIRISPEWSFEDQQAIMAVAAAWQVQDRVWFHWTDEQCPGPGLDGKMPMCVRFLPDTTDGIVRECDNWSARGCESTDLQFGMGIIQTDTIRVSTDPYYDHRRGKMFIHEFGHFLGLNHACTTDAVMYGWYSKMADHVTDNDWALFWGASTC